MRETINWDLPELGQIICGELNKIQLGVEGAEWFWNQRDGKTFEIHFSAPNHGPHFIAHLAPQALKREDPHGMAFVKQLDSLLFNTRYMLKATADLEMNPLCTEPVTEEYVETANKILEALGEDTPARSLIEAVELSAVVASKSETVRRRAARM